MGGQKAEEEAKGGEEQPTTQGVKPGLGGCGKVKGCNRFLTGCNRRLPRLQPSNQVAIQAKLG